MNQNQKSNFSLILLFTILVCCFSGSIPVFNDKPTTDVVTRKLTIEDSSRIILLLDTSVLGPFFFPIRGKVISHFGKRGRRMHTGTDIKLAHGDTVSAAFTGVVVKAQTYFGYGLLVVLQHPEKLETYYAHLSKILVKEGDTLEYGTPLGLGGRTGRATTDHLHFEIRNKGKALNSEHFFNFDECNIRTMVWLRNSELKELKEQEESETPEKATNVKVPLKHKSQAPAHKVEHKFHTIKKGDTLFSLSRKYGTSVEDICKLNRLKKTSVLKVGRKIRIL